MGVPVGVCGVHKSLRGRNGVCGFGEGAGGGSRPPRFWGRGWGGVPTPPPVLSSPGVPVPADAPARERLQHPALHPLQPRHQRGQGGVHPCVVSPKNHSKITKTSLKSPKLPLNPASATAMTETGLHLHAVGPRSPFGNCKLLKTGTLFPVLHPQAQARDAGAAGGLRGGAAGLGPGAAAGGGQRLQPHVLHSPQEDSALAGTRCLHQPRWEPKPPPKNLDTTPKFLCWDPSPEIPLSALRTLDVFGVSEGVLMVLFCSPDCQPNCRVSLRSVFGGGFWVVLG